MDREDRVAEGVRLVLLRLGQLRCVECSARVMGFARGWRAFLTCEDEVAVFCGECAAREFDA
jgi:hypothetical protein